MYNKLAKSFMMEHSKLKPTITEYQIEYTDKDIINLWMRQSDLKGIKVLLNYIFYDKNLLFPSL